MRFIRKSARWGFTLSVIITNYLLECSAWILAPGAPAYLHSHRGHGFHVLNGLPRTVHTAGGGGVGFAWKHAGGTEETVYNVPVPTFPTSEESFSSTSLEAWGRKSKDLTGL